MTKRSFLFIVSLIFFQTASYAELKNGMDAEVVVGQPDFVSGTANNGGRRAETLSSPAGIYSDGKRLIAVDADNHRVLIWNTIPASNFAPADIVLGQPDFASGTANNGGVGARTLNTPRAVYTDGRRLFVSDFSNNRVLIWNSIPTANFAAADVVVGQSNFTATGAATTQAGVNRPQGLSSDGKKLFVSDRNGNRVLIWNSIPQSNGVPADVVVGQATFTASIRDAGHMNRPDGVYSDGKRLFVSDESNSRILIWNSVPTSNTIKADVVLGQSNFFSIQSSIATACFPEGIHSDGKRLFVADTCNRRILIWDSIPQSNGTRADVVLGQPDFITVNGTGSKSILGSVAWVFMTGKQLFVSDFDNHRIMIYNLVPESAVNLGPQFNQGKAVLGKVFEDPNSNGVQDNGEKGIEGAKVASDTGIYAITDEDGKYHFPYIETGQHILKLDPATLPEGSTLTTESPRKVVVTKGILTKVSFGVKPKPEAGSSKPEEKPSTSSPLLKVSVSQDPVLLKPILSIEAKPEKDKLIFTIHCNYFLFVEKAELHFYDSNLKPIKTIPLPSPLPSQYSVPASELSDARCYQLSIWDKQGKEDRTSVAKLEIAIEPLSV